MSFIINYIIIFAFSITFISDNSYKYILIITSKNCSPCIVKADEFLAKNKLKYLLVNIYENKAEKKYSDESILSFCKESKCSKSKSVKNKYTFGAYNFSVKDGGPYLIKYSKLDTIIYNPLTIDDVSN